MVVSFVYLLEVYNFYPCVKLTNYHLNFSKWKIWISNCHLSSISTHTHTHINTPWKVGDAPFISFCVRWQTKFIISIYVVVKSMERPIVVYPIKIKHVLHTNICSHIHLSNLSLLLLLNLRDMQMLITIWIFDYNYFLFQTKPSRNLLENGIKKEVSRIHSNCLTIFMAWFKLNKSVNGLGPEEKSVNKLSKFYSN